MAVAAEAVPGVRRRTKKGRPTIAYADPSEDVRPKPPSVPEPPNPKAGARRDFKENFRHLTKPGAAEIRYSIHKPSPRKGMHRILDLRKDSKPWLEHITRPWYQTDYTSQFSQQRTSSHPFAFVLQNGHIELCRTLYHSGPSESTPDLPSFELSRSSPLSTVAQHPHCQCPVEAVRPQDLKGRRGTASPFRVWGIGYRMPDLKGQRRDLQAAAAMRMFGLSRVQHFWEPTKDSRVLLG